MTAMGWLQIALFSLVILALTKPLGVYMFRVYEGDDQPLKRVFGPLERVLYRASGVDPTREQTWVEYAVGVMWFSAVSLVITYLIERTQHLLPLNPQKL